jgi:hypothetical protein
MNLQFLRPGENAPAANELTAWATTAVATAAAEPGPARPAGVALHAILDAAGPIAGGTCRSAADSVALSPDDGRPLGCPNDEAEVAGQEKRGKAAALLDVDGILLDAPDAWYAAGPEGAGFGLHCEARLQRTVRDDYGEQLLPLEILPAIARAPTDAAPFWREREALRLRTGVEHGQRIARIIRDEARRARNIELKVGGRLLGLSAASVLLAKRLDYAVLTATAPSGHGIDLGACEVLDAALVHRPLVLLAPPEVAATTNGVQFAARVASSVGAELSLPLSAPAASHAELSAHRLFWREFRSHYRPAERLAEVLLLYSAQSDHWSRGLHGERVRAFAEALTRAAIQYRVVLEVPRTGSEPLILAECSHLDEEDSGRIDRRITEGASAIVAGRCRTSDDCGRHIAGPFVELSAGLNRVGAGSVILLDTAPDGKSETLAPLEKALESLLGRGRRAVSVSRPGFIVKMYLDPDRKLDVHVVSRPLESGSGAAGETRGLALYLSGSAVSGARSGTVFSQGATERKIPLTTFGMGVQATLPDFNGSAILSISR